MFHDLKWTKSDKLIKIELIRAGHFKRSFFASYVRVTIASILGENFKKVWVWKTTYLRLNK